MADINIKKGGMLLAAVFLLILAIQTMKEGARGFGIHLQGTNDLTGPLKTMGLGWLSASLILSGSPIAAAALALFDSGALTQIDAFTMLNGSRFGVSAAILLLGFLYHLRGHERHTSLSLGILTLLVTYTIYIPGIFIGILLLKYDVLDFLQFKLPIFFMAAVEKVFDPIVEALSSRLPGWLVFLVGVGAIMGSFRLFDGALPKVELRETRFRWTAHYIYRPWVMFALGLLLTTITPSVSVSLGLLVPLSARGYVKVENLVPYIMGANIATLSDTLIVAVLLANPEVFTIVVAEIAGLAVFSAFVLLFLFHAYEKFMLSSLLAISMLNRNLVLFLFVTFVIPLILIMT